MYLTILYGVLWKSDERGLDFVSCFSFYFSFGCRTPECVSSCA